MNRFIAATRLNYKDELIWYPEFRGKVVRCIWRNGISGHPEMNDTITFLMLELDDLHNVKSILQVYTLILDNTDRYRKMNSKNIKTTIPEKRINYE